MNIIHLPISVLDNILNQICETHGYASIRISCKSLYYLLPEVKRYYINKRIREVFIFTNHILNGYHITWYVNQTVSKMVMYVNTKKENQEVLYFPSGNVKRVSLYQNGKLNGIQKIYSNYEKKLIRYTEYKNNKKVNEELIYNNKGFVIYKIIHIDDNVYTLYYYDNNYRIVKANFVNDILQGIHTSQLVNPDNIKYYRFDKKVNKYNYGILDSISLYQKDSLVENFTIKNGMKHGWAYNWYANHKLKAIGYFNQNKFEKKYRLWHKNFGSIETFTFKDNKLNGLYKSSSIYTEKTIPYMNNLINGYVEEKIKSCLYSSKIKFKNNKFDSIIKIEKDFTKVEIYFDLNYFIYTKYVYNKKKFTLKIINNMVSLVFYDNGLALQGHTFYVPQQYPMLLKS